MRLALISTPRSGNTWLRMLLAALYGLNHSSVHDATEIDWPRLPDKSIVQVHWTRTPDFANHLESCGVRVVTIARHPLDILVSILHFSRHEPETRHWLLGEGGGEERIRGAAPGDVAFEVFATSARAAKLLGVTPSWWNDARVFRVNYESLVSSTVSTLSALAAALGPHSAAVEAVVQAHTLSALRTTSRNEHFWQGNPGLWQSLLTEEQSNKIAHAHSVVFETLGYSLTRRIRPSMEEAAQAWQQLAMS
jgi:hypothetical protein